MTEAGTNPKPTAQAAVAQLMDQGDIKIVAVVDDVFAGPSVADYRPADFEEFWAEVQYDEAALAELKSFGVSIQAADEIDQNVLRALLANRSSLDRVKPAFERCLAPTFDAKLEPVNDLCDCLEADLRRTVVKSDGMASLKDSSIRLIFLDYFLEEGNETASIRKARRIAEEIKEKYTETPKPLVLLMSSKQIITSDKIASLRRGAGFLGSMFEFIPKQEFINRDRLVITLGCIAKAFRERQQVQQFVEAVENSVEDATRRFRESVRSLSFEDYAYIQKLSLQREGHPLGDYVSWLYSTYFGHLLFDTIPEQDTLDALSFSRLPTASFEPSSQFTEIFKNIVTEEVEPVSGHPRDKRAGEASAPALIHFGDVFSNDGTEVLMVISAECDLAFTPDEADRPFDPERSVLLIPGTLSTQNQLASSAFKTDFFAHRNEVKRITWHPQNVISVPHGQIREWLEKRGYGRETRLRLPFALEVQRAFAADISRIGMPVGPPIYRPATVQIGCKDKDGKIALLETLPRAAFIFRAREDQVVLSRGCLVQIADIVDKALVVLTDAKQAQVAKGGSAQGHDARMSQLEALKNSFAELMEFAGPFALPSTSGNALKGLPVTVYKNHSMEGRYNSATALMLNIVDVDANSVAAAATGTA